MIASALLLAAMPAVVQSAPPLPSDPVAADWQAIPDDEMMIVTLKDGRRVAVRLAARFVPQHVANIRALARARWWDDASVYRVQDNWVAQWGDASEKKPLPSGVSERPARRADQPVPDHARPIAEIGALILRTTCGAFLYRM